MASRSFLSIGSPPVRRTLRMPSCVNSFTRATTS
jgi:hypothetical protein